VDLSSAKAFNSLALRSHAARASAVNRPSPVINAQRRAMGRRWHGWGAAILPVAEATVDLAIRLDRKECQAHAPKHRIKQFGAAQAIGHDHKPQVGDHM